MTVLRVGDQTVSISFAPSGSSVRCKLHIDYTSETHRDSVITEDDNFVDVNGLNPGTEYKFSIKRITESGNQSEATSVSVFTGKSDLW